MSTPLIATTDLLGGSNKLTVTKNTAIISNPELHKHISLHKHEDDLWHIALDDAAALTQWPYDEALGATTHIAANVRRGARTRLRPATKSSQLRRLIRLHERMDHRPIGVMHSAIANGQWLNSGVELSTMRDLWADYKCVACQCQRNAIPKSVATDVRTKKTGNTISVDPVPVNIPGLDGEHWIFLFKDVATGYWQAWFAKAKSEFPGCLKAALQFYVEEGWKPEVLRTDDEWVLKSEDVGSVLKEFRMIHQRSGPYHHYQNTVERDVQTLVKQCSTVLHGQTLLKACFWTMVIDHLVMIHNRSPNRSTDTETPQSLVMSKDCQKRTNLANTFQFKIGELVAVGVQKEHRTWKFDTKRELGIYVGQPEGSVDTHYIYFPYEGNVLLRGDVISLDIPPEAIAEFYVSKLHIREGRSSYAAMVELVNGLGLNADVAPAAPRPSTTSVEPPLRMGTRNRPPRIGDKPPTVRTSTSSSYSLLDLLERFELMRMRPPPVCSLSAGARVAEARDPGSSSTNPSIQGIRNDGLKPRGFDPDAEIPPDFLVHTYAARSHGPDNPTVTKALSSVDRDDWREAIIHEVKINLIQSGTLVPIDQTPPGALMSWITFVLKRKRKQDREDRFKARGCYRGDLLEKGYAETYSPTVSPVTCSTLQQIAVIDEMNQALVDTVGAFLVQDYPDEAPVLCVKLDAKIAAICGLPPRQVYRVRKYIYGIPDAGRAYYKAYSKTLIDSGYKQSKLDPCLFFRIYGPKDLLWAWIHVDDTWVAASRPELVDQFVTNVEGRFEVTREPVDNYLGVHYETLSDGSVRKTQPKLLESMFEKYQTVDCPRVKTPALLPVTSVWEDTSVFPPIKYLSLLGVLLYALMSRPDIAFAVTFAATKAKAPTDTDWRALIRIVQYLYQTRTKGLILRKQSKGCDLRMYIYVDASYLLYPDSKAQTGYCLSLNDQGPYYCKSQKQSVVTTSSTHSEMRAFFTAVTDYVLVEQITAEVGRPLVPPAIVNEDNAPVITVLSREQALPKACKHFMMLINYARELIADGLIEPRKVLTWENFSDILTKHVYGQDYQYKAQQVLGPQPGESLLVPYAPKPKMLAKDTVG